MVGCLVLNTTGRQCLVFFFFFVVVFLIYLPLRVLRLAFSVFEETICYAALWGFFWGCVLFKKVLIVQLTPNSSANYAGLFRFDKSL